MRPSLPRGNHQSASQLPEAIGHSGPLPWTLSLLAFMGYILSIGYGGALTYMPLLFIVSICVGAFPEYYLKTVMRYRILLLIPSLSIISTLWSDYSAISFKLSFELMLHTIIAISVAITISLNCFTSSFLCALLLINLTGMFFGGQELIYTTGEFASNGFFGSKNNFALFSSFLCIFSISTLIDKNRSIALRCLSAFAAVFSITLLGMTKSVGAILACVVATSFVPFTYLMREAGQAVRPAILGGLFLTILVVAASLYLLVGDLDTALRLVGKSSDLTGRTVLWAKAQRLMDIRPWLGTGYQAFWVQGNPEAEALWTYGRVASRAGFHFHNTFYAIGVELGYVGILAQILTVGVILRTALGAYLKTLRLPYVLLISLYFMLLARLPNEVDGLGPFSIGIFLSAIVYVYASQVEGSHGTEALMRQPVKSLPSGDVVQT